MVEVDETSDWCNSFILVPKPNCSVHLCLDAARLNQALIRPVHRDPTDNDIFPRLTNTRNITLSDASSGKHNLKLCKNHI